MSRTPLFLAAEEGHTEVVKLLLTKGAKVDARDKNDDTPLMRAVGGREPALEVCAALVEAGADVNARDNMARTPLHFAAVAGKEEIVRSLLEKGASPTAKDKSGKTPADYASSARIKQLLVEAAAGKGAEDAGAADSGKTELPPAPQPKRAWGPEQATGEPDTKSAGDIRTAWASKTPDAQDEWLELDYAEALTPAAVKVYETYNPGALHKVCDSGGKEIVVWEGDDPTPSTTNMGVSEIAFTSNVKAKRVKLYLKSKEVKGWNEIDAVGLVDTDGTMHWAVSATASSTYAE
jgi:hypothetical protein